MKDKITILKYYTIIIFLVIASLDNAVIEMIPTVYFSMEQSLGFSNMFLVFVDAMLIWVVATVAIPWAYYGDKGRRKRLLLFGTAIWVGALAFTPLVTNGITWFLLQLISGFGLASIASVGFSIIADFIAPEKRGTAMSLWNLTQTFGSFIGRFLPVLLVSKNELWWVPFVVLSMLGLIFMFLYLFTLDPVRGGSEKVLEGIDYDYVISKKDLLPLVKRKTNFLLIVQSFTGQVAWGSILLLPYTFTIILMRDGLPENTANQAGNLLATIFWGAGVLSILFGYIGDKLNEKSSKARPWMAMIGLIAGIPFIIFTLHVFNTRVDLPSLAGKEDFASIAFTLVEEFFSNGSLALMLILGATGAGCYSTVAPSGYAIIIDANLPEHRGTIFAVGNLIQGIGRGIGTFLTPLIAGGLATSMAKPTSYVWSISILQLFFIPSALCFFIISKVLDDDLEKIRSILLERSRGT